MPRVIKTSSDKRFKLLHLFVSSVIPLSMNKPMTYVFLDGTLSFSFLMLMLIVPYQTSPSRQRVQIYLWTGVIFLVFSVLISLFKVKNRGKYLSPHPKPPFTELISPRLSFQASSVRRRIGLCKKRQNGHMDRLPHRPPEFELPKSTMYSSDIVQRT